MSDGPPADPAPGDTYVVVVSPDVTATNLTMEELRRLFFFRERRWKSGPAASLVYSEEGLEPGSFLLTAIYHMSYPELRRLILEKLYQGEIALAPRVAPSDGIAVTYVASGRGLVALVPAAVGQGTRAKILTIDGLAPGSAGYALKR